MPEKFSSKQCIMCMCVSIVKEVIFSRTGLEKLLDFYAYFMNWLCSRTVLLEFTTDVDMNMYM